MLLTERSNRDSLEYGRHDIGYEAIGEAPDYVYERCIRLMDFVAEMLAYPPGHQALEVSVGSF